MEVSYKLERRVVVRVLKSQRRLAADTVYAVRVRDFAVSVDAKGDNGDRAEENSEMLWPRYLCCS